MTTSDIAQLLADIERAGDTVPPSWPLSSTIAVNPLAGFEDRPFAQGVVEGADLFGGRGLLTLADSGIKGNAEYIAWTKAYHAALGPAMARPLKLWTLDSAYVGFRYGFYSYLADCGFNGFPLIVELANHMSRADAEWLRDNPGPIGRALAGTATYFLMFLT